MVEGRGWGISPLSPSLSQVGISEAAEAGQMTLVPGSGSTTSSLCPSSLEAAVASCC